jgi:hypothetical protein
VDITTGNQDPDKDARIFFLGFNGFFAGGREFRLRKGNDANPFRGGPEQLIFGVGSNVKNPGYMTPLRRTHLTRTLSILYISV